MGCNAEMKINPIHQSHAIESVSFGVEWPQPLPPTVMATLESVYEAALKELLPSKKPMQHLEVQINPAGGNAVRQTHASGWVFERFQPNGLLERNLALTANTLAVTCHTYTRWSETFSEALKLMRPFVPLISASSGGFTAFGLQYLDTFVIEGQEADFRPEMVLSTKSKTLPASVFERRSLWHAHHGYFTDLPSRPERRQLTVINTDLVRENTSLLLRILSMHRTLFASPLVYTDEAPLNEAMIEMHDENKELLRDMLNADMLRAVGFAE